MSYGVSQHYSRLMTIVSAERSKHRDIINCVTNTTFALSRRPLTYKNNKMKLRMECITTPPLQSTRTKRSTKRVRFGTLVTFEDNSSPVPIRPPRKKSLRLKRSSSSPRTSRQRPLNSHHEDCVPQRPHRVYKGRGVTPLSEALQPLQDKQFELVLDNVKLRMKTAQKNINDQNKKRTVLSSLNLFLALAYERLRKPSELSDIKCQDSLLMIAHGDVCCREGVEPQPGRGRVPTAVQQLKGGVKGKLYLRNIPTLLLFNLIYGRSL